MRSLSAARRPLRSAHVGRRHRSAWRSPSCCLRRCDARCAPTLRQAGRHEIRRAGRRHRPASTSCPHPAVELLVQGQFVPRAVDAVDHGRRCASRSKPVRRTRATLRRRRSANRACRVPAHRSAWRAQWDPARSSIASHAGVASVAGSRPSSSAVCTAVAERRTATPRRSTSVVVVPGASAAHWSADINACGRTSDDPELDAEVVGHGERGLVAGPEPQGRCIPERQEREHHCHRDQGRCRHRPKRLGSCLREGELRQRPSPRARRRGRPQQQSGRAGSRLRRVRWRRARVLRPAQGRPSDSTCRQTLSRDRSTPRGPPVPQRRPRRWPVPGGRAARDADR